MTRLTKFDPRFENDYEQVKPILQSLGLPQLPRTVYEKMRQLFRVKHGYSKREKSWIGTGGHGLLIYGLARKLRPRVAVDVGTYLGFSALCLALAIEEEMLETKVLTIDSSQHIDYGRDEFFDRLRSERVVELVGNSSTVLSTLPEQPIDFAFIDGGHYYEAVSFDSDFVGCRLADYGVMLMDDCMPEYDGVLQAAIETQHKYNLYRIDFWVLRS